MTSENVLLRANGIKMYFKGKNHSIIKANDDISLCIYEGEVLGIVGESSCGKSTFGRTLLCLYQATEGEIIYYPKECKQGIQLTKRKESELRKLRRELQMVFQDPYSSLDPRMSVGRSIEEGVKTHHMFDRKKERVAYVKEVMKQCGLDETMYFRYPREFSGGQRQRISIARSIALKPKFLVCDEAVSALDVSIQSQIINLLLDLKEKENMTYLFISHDLSVVRYISDRIGVMYLGHLVELAPTEELFEQPMHPYTKILFDSIPKMEGSNEIISLTGEIPNPANPPKGCPFHTRCPYVKEICETIRPELMQKKASHQVACHYPFLCL